MTILNFKLRIQIGHCFQNWYRVAQDESLWKCLTFRRLGCRYSRHNAISWKSELKRLTYHVPVYLHQTCEGHVDEVYYVCFSNSGQLLATCGADGIVNVSCSRQSCQSFLLLTCHWRTNHENESPPNRRNNHVKWNWVHRILNLGLSTEWII